MWDLVHWLCPKKETGISIWDIPRKESGIVNLRWREYTFGCDKIYLNHKVVEEFELIGAMPSSWYGLLCMEWQFRGNKKKSKLLWRSCCLALSWCIWQEINARIFQDEFSEAAEVWCKIKQLASLWASSSNLFGILSVTELCCNWGAAVLWESRFRSMMGKL